MAAFAPDVLADLAEREEVQIETAAPSRGPGATRTTIIWIVVEGKDAFVRSVRGDRGRWYREVLAQPEATIHFRGKPRREPVAVRAVHAPDAGSVARCSRALEAKYGRDPALKSMLREDTLGTTVRLEAR